jgi:hypothetical protein
VTPCSPVAIHRRFGGTFCAYHQLQSKAKESSTCCLVIAWLFFLFFFNLCGGTLGTAATTGLFIVPAPDDRWWWLWRNWWNEDCAGETEVLGQKLCPSASLCTTYPTWLDPGLNPGRRGWKPASNRLSYSVDYYFAYSSILKMEIVCPFETPVNYYLRILHRIPEDNTLRNDHCKKKKIIYL